MIKALVLANCLFLATFALSAAAPPPPASSPSPFPGQGDFDAQADRFQALSPDQWLLEGNVTFRSAGVLLQADRVTYDRSTGRGEATGNVLYVQGTGRIAGDRLSFDLKARTAEIFNATGFLDQGFLFRARKVMQIDNDHIRFEKGHFTACTQPVPYWSFHVHSGLVIRNRYVHLYNLSLRAGRVPVFYSPYLVFPIKSERATGLLLPQIGFSQRLGSSLGNAFFWDIRRNQDATFFLDAFNQGSLGRGVEYRLVPNQKGAAIFNAYLLEEDGLAPTELPERRRWSVRFKERQDFRPGERLLADFNFVSDADYYLDFSRDPDRGSDPSAFSRLEYVLNRGYTSLNVRSERREQFFADDSVIQSRIPEAEVRIRSRRLGKSPFFLALESSGSLLDKSLPDTPSQTYGRFDIFPTLSLPLSPLPYLDITPTLRLRETYYTQSLAPGSSVLLDPNQPPSLAPGQPALLDAGLSREFLQFDLQVLGPRLSRISMDEEGVGRYKSTLEPRVTYRYHTSPQSDENLRVPRFDEIDIIPSEVNEFRYGVVSRLFARKKVHTPLAPGENGRDREESGDIPPPGTPSTTLTPGGQGAGTAMHRLEVGGLPGQTVNAGNSFTTLPAQPPATESLTSPVEIASFSISQRFSFMSPLSFDREARDTDGDGQVDSLITVDDSRFSPITFASRINPSAGTSVNAQMSYDILEQAVSSASVSAGLNDPRRGFLNTTWFFRNGLDGLSLNSSQLRVSGGSSFFRRKISTSVSLNYDATLSKLQDQRYRFGYDTQCCGFAVELLQRNFEGTEQREFRFLVNLRGIGNFLDLQGGGSAR
ncbi:MAG: LPS-assembly protein LptD [Acidobacteriota bacterium]